MAQAVEHLTTKYEAQSSNLSTKKEIPAHPKYI
jgi:hypothetical protein